MADTEKDFVETEETVETMVDEAEKAAIVVDQARIEEIIRRNAYGATALGIVPIQGVDFIGVTALQLNLVRQLSKLYGVPFKEGLARKIITSVVGGAVPAVLASPVSSVLRKVPLIGLPLCIATSPALNGWSTYAVGKMFAKHFASGGNFETINLTTMKRDFKQAYSNARTWLGDKIGGRKAAEA
ncbi:MAG: YcjF family protein [Oscillospiraceae bacterium]|nr:YcjF family protein [Oscillospiraceae bacterium]